MYVHKYPLLCTHNTHMYVHVWKVQNTMVLLTSRNFLGEGGQERAVWSYHNPAETQRKHETQQVQRSETEAGLRQDYTSGRVFQAELTAACGRSWPVLKIQAGQSEEREGETYCLSLHGYSSAFVLRNISLKRNPSFVCFPHKIPVQRENSITPAHVGPEATAESWSGVSTPSFQHRRDWSPLRTSWRKADPPYPLPLGNLYFSLFI